MILAILQVKPYMLMVECICAKPLFLKGFYENFKEILIHTLHASKNRGKMRARVSRGTAHFFQNGDSCVVF